MTIHVHIERLILDGLTVGPAQGAHVRAALSLELGRLLSAGGLGPELSSGGARPRIDAGTISMSSGSVDSLGRGIAGAVYRGLTG